MSVYETAKTCTGCRIAQYLRYILVHKYHVYVAGRALGLPRLQLLVHDLTKLTPSEFKPYLNWFYPRSDRTQEDMDAFDLAWNLHQKRNRHHPSYWLLTRDSGEQIPLEMPKKYVAEMVADWVGAGAALGTPNTWAWYAENGHLLRMHRTTRAVAETLLESLQPRPRPPGST